MYYNTNREVGETLQKSEAKTKSQDEEIFDFIQNSSQKDFTRSELEKQFQQYPASSIVRALNTLVKENKLEKTDNMRMGGYGKMVHTWRIKLIEIGENGQSAIRF